NAGRSRFPDSPPDQVLTFSLTSVPKGCIPAVDGPRIGGEATAVAYTPGGMLLVQSRQPATLTVEPSGDRITLSNDDVIDTGPATFHTDSGPGIACMSCHAEGGDDGRVWNIDGQRRTLSLRGGVTQRAPFHWTGDLPNLKALLLNVLGGRMSGPLLD